MIRRKSLILKSVAFFCALLMVLGLIAGCDLQCKHTFENGECTACHYKCPHDDYDENGVCEICGYKCKHLSYDENGTCEECGYKCPHEDYDDNGVCEICGYQCPHEHYLNGICEECEYACPHFFSGHNGVCGVCDYVCPHLHYDADGNCEVCGRACTHAWDGKTGVCKICGKGCTHDWSGENGVCTICKKICSHNYGADDVCKVCGKHKPEDGGVPAIRVTVSNDFITKEATKNYPYYDNTNAANNYVWQYYDCEITADECAEEYAFANSAAQIKVRGNWTTTYPKKPFRLKFDKKQSMFGLNDGAKCKSWVLLANYKDCSLERNSVAFYLADGILGEDGYYSSDCKQVELYLNDQYWGVYLLAEQQQVNKNRVDITEAEPDPVTNEPYLGTDIGYLIEYDGYCWLENVGERFSCNHNNNNNVGYTIKSDVYEDTSYPEGNDNRYPQRNFIQSYINNVYTLCSDAVKGNYKTFNSDFTGLVKYTPTTNNPVYETVSRVIDIQSLVDMYMHCEIACDYDLAWSSFFLDVDFGPNAKNNLLRFEAPWDFDSAFGLRDACASGEGEFAKDKNPWLRLFYNQSWFKKMVAQKWEQVRASGLPESAIAYVRGLAKDNADAYARNNQKWGFNVNGEANWDFKNKVHDQASATEQLCEWLEKRFNSLGSIWGSWA